MPIVGIPLDEFYSLYGEELPPDILENELHRFGCSVEGWATLQRYRCPRCHALSETGESTPPPTCDSCGADFRLEANRPAPEGEVRVLRMELLAVRPDLFDPPGLARALRGFLGKEAGAPVYRLEKGTWSVEIDPALAGPEVLRPRIAMAVVKGLSLNDASLRSLMKLQENIHWALGRDRKLASIGVYDLSTITGSSFRYQAVTPEALSFVPLGYDPADAESSLTPARILTEHPKGKAYARLLQGATRVPLLIDETGAVLSMPPIINSEATRVTRETEEVVIDVTGLEDRHIERALNIVVTSLLEVCPSAHAESVTLHYAGETRTTPDLSAQEVDVDPAAAAELVGTHWNPGEFAELLRRMRHDTVLEGDRVQVQVPAWRADIVHPRDLVEDAAIAHGYDHLPSVDLTAATFAEAHPREIRAARARAVLLGLSAMEVMTLTLSSEATTFERTGLRHREEQVRLEHPISVEQTMLRVSLVPGLMETLAVNLGHSYPQRIFEVGSVVFADETQETGAREDLHAAAALAGDGFGYADARGLAEAFLADWGLTVASGLEFQASEERLFLPGRGAEILLAGRALGRVGEVHPAVLEAYRIIHPVVLFEVNLEDL